MVRARALLAEEDGSWNTTVDYDRDRDDLRQFDLGERCRILAERRHAPRKGLGQVPLREAPGAAAGTAPSGMVLEG